jgi:hypothetical protein
MENKPKTHNTTKNAVKCRFFNHFGQRILNPYSLLTYKILVLLKKLTQYN